MTQIGPFTQVMEKAAQKKIPLACHFDLTYQCNLNCVHCYVVREDRPELSTSEIRGILDQLAKAGTLDLTFSGGEIFAREDFFEIAEYARRLHFALRLMTNGILIDEQVADRVAALYPDLVSISIYSTTPEIHDGITLVPGSLARTIRAARMLRDRKVKLEIGSVLMSQNINDYSKVYELAQSIGASFRSDPRVTPRNNGDPFPLKFQINEDDLSRVWKDPIFSSQPTNEPEEFHSPGEIHSPEEFLSKDDRGDILCGAAHMSFYVSPYGDIHPCVQFPALCGNLRNEFFEKIWYHSLQMLEVRSTLISQLPICSKCNLVEHCRTCPGLSYIEEGDFRAPSKTVCQEARIISDINIGGDA
jgi:radical SAM protein with 4Fe4S-binding SPASM domain